MNAISILIVEDEPIIAADLAFMLSNMGYQVYDPVGSGEEALVFLKTNEPDLILMDIQLDGDMDGIDTAHQINATTTIPIIFLTSNTDTQTFGRAKLTRPHAFLSKPFREADLRNSIELAFDRNESTTVPDDGPALVHDDRIFVKVKDRMVKLMLEEVLWMEADRYYSWIVTADKKYLATVSLKKLSENIPETIFARANRSQVINTQKVDEMSDHYLYIGQEKIQIGKTYKEDLMKRFLRF